MGSLGRAGFCVNLFHEHSFRILIKRLTLSCFKTNLFAYHLPFVCIFVFCVILNWVLEFTETAEAEGESHGFEENLNSIFF